jgi:hypothetical protein
MPGSFTRCHSTVETSRHRDTALLSSLQEPLTVRPVSVAWLHVSEAGLALDTATIASERTIRSDHTMTGYDNSNRI